MQQTDHCMPSQLSCLCVSRADSSRITGAAWTRRRSRGFSSRWKYNRSRPKSSGERSITSPLKGSTSCPPTRPRCPGSPLCSPQRTAPTQADEHQVVLPDRLKPNSHPANKELINWGHRKKNIQLERELCSVTALPYKLLLFLRFN